MLLPSILVFLSRTMGLLPPFKPRLEQLAQNRHRAALGRYPDFAKAQVVQDLGEGAFRGRPVREPRHVPTSPILSPADTPAAGAASEHLPHFVRPFASWSSHTVSY